MAKGIIKPLVRIEERPYPSGHRYFRKREGCGIQPPKFNIFEMEGENLLKGAVETMASVGRISRKMRQAPVPSLHLADLGPTGSEYKKSRADQEKGGNDNP
jgi:hypothetical protein